MKVSELLRLLHNDGWYLAATRGSHRQFKHLVKPGRVTVPGNPATIWLLELSTLSSNSPA
jgi:predicted RNA binding protein YcfA (HicA-like mRNA interferase family)